MLWIFSPERACLVSRKSKERSRVMLCCHITFDSVLKSVSWCSYSHKSRWMVLISGSFLLCCTRWFQRLTMVMKFLSVTIHIKAIEQFFLFVLFIMLYKILLTFESIDEIQKYDHSNESYWTVLSCGTFFIMRNRVYLTLERADEILKGDQSNVSCWAILSCGSVFNMHFDLLWICDLLRCGTVTGSGILSWARPK